MAKYVPPTQEIYDRAISAWRKTVAEWEEADHRAVDAVKKQRRNDGIGEGNLIAYCESKLRT